MSRNLTNRFHVVCRRAAQVRCVTRPQVSNIHMRQTLRTIFLLAAALLMSFAALMNATVNVPHLREDMVEINVRPTLLGAVLLGLHFSTFAMFAFACVVLVAAVQSLRASIAARVPLLTIAVANIAFGFFAFVWSRSHHTLGYVLMGVLILGAVAIREAR